MVKTEYFYFGEDLMNLRDRKSIWKTLHLSWEEADGSESKHFFSSSFDLTWSRLRSHLFLPENWANPTSSGLISLLTDITSPSISSLTESQCAGVCGGSQGRGDVLRDTGLTWSCPSLGPVCSTEAGEGGFTFCPFSPQSHWPIHDLAIFCK